MRLTLVHPRLATWGSGHDVAVWRLACALAADPDIALTVVTGPRGAAVPGARLWRLPAIPLWHGGLEFHSFRLAWMLARRLIAGDAVYAGTPLLPGADVAAVHFLSLDWQEARPPPSGGWRSRLRAWDDRWRHALGARLEAAAYTHPRRPLLLAVSPALADRLRQRFGLEAPEVAVVPNPLDVEACRPAPAPTHPPRLLFVGGGWARKRLDIALYTLARVPPPADLWVIGAGPVAEATAQAKALGIAGRVHFLGPRRDVPALMAGATALLLPSAYETDGLVAWEALACAVPVIAPPRPAYAPWLEDGVSGLAADGAEAMATAACRLIADPTLARQGRSKTVGRTAPAVAEMTKNHIRGRLASRPLPSVLLVKIGRLGDTLTALPTARALLDHGQRVSLLCAAPMAPLAEALVPGLRALPVPWAALRGVAGVARAWRLSRHLPRFAAALLSPNEASGAHLLAALVARRRIGFAGGVARAEALTGERLPADTARPVADLTLDLARHWLRRPDLPAPAALPRRSPPRGYGLVHPGSAVALRRWPLACFQEVAARLRAATGLPWHMVTQERPILDFLDAVAGAVGLVGCHSGPVQLAALCGVPWVAVGGPTPAAWDPPGGVVLRAGLPCQPCGRFLGPPLSCPHAGACLHAPASGDGAPRLTPAQVATAMLEGLACAS